MLEKNGPFRWFLLALMIGATLSGNSQANSERADFTKNVRFVLRTASTSLIIHHPASFTLTLTNTGSEPIYVPALLNIMSSREIIIDLQVLDGKGNRVPLVTDILDCLSEPRTDNWRERLQTQWILLYPQYSYSHALTLDPARHEFPDKIGKYKMTATLNASFLYYNPKKSPFLDVAPQRPQLPHVVLDGELKTDEVAVTIH